MGTRRRRFLGIAFLLLATTGSCAVDGDARPDVAFWNELRTLCGRAFGGTAIRTTPLDSAVLGEPLVLSIWQCWNEEVRIAFHVGDDHSRVWQLQWDDDRLHLIHSIHTADGELADPSNYGGFATANGSAQRLTFAPDDDTLLRFPSVRGSVWTLELVPRERLMYAFGPAEDAERFRLDFDLTESVSRPPPPWGWTRNP